MLLDNSIELFGIEQTGARSGDRRRRVDRDYIVLLGRAFEVASSVIDDHMGQRRAQQRRSIRVIIAKQAGDARHQLYRGHRYSPGKQRPVGCSHTEAHYQSVLRRMIEKTTWHE